MTAHEYLDQLTGLSELIHSYREELERIRKDYGCPGSSSAPRSGAQSGGWRGGTADTRRADRAADIDAEIQRLEKKQAKILASIDEVGNARYRMALRMKYVDELPNKIAAGKMGVSTKTYGRLLGNGLCAVHIPHIDVSS